MITAIVFVNADVARIPEVAEQIAAIEGVSEVYSVTGQIDLIAMVRGRSTAQVAMVVSVPGQIALIPLVRVRSPDDGAMVVADRLNKVPGVQSTETHIAFRAYS